MAQASIGLLKNTGLLFYWRKIAEIYFVRHLGKLDRTIKLKHAYYKNKQLKDKPPLLFSNVKSRKDNISGNVFENNFSKDTKCEVKDSTAACGEISIDYVSDGGSVSNASSIS